MAHLFLNRDMIFNLTFMNENAETITINAIAQSMNLNINSGQSLLARNSIFYLKNILSLAIRILKSKNKKKLTHNEINESLKAKNMQPLYGYNNRLFKTEKECEYVPIDDKKEVLVPIDHMITLKSLDEIEKSLFGVDNELVGYPIETIFKFHWLAVQGNQVYVSNTRENDSSVNVAPEEIHWPTYLTNQKETSGRQINPAAIMPDELQRVFISTIECIMQNNDIDDILEELSNSGSLSQLLPFYIRFLIDSIKINIRNPHHMLTFLSITKALLKNDGLTFDNYLHYVLSIIITSLTSEFIGEDQLDLHFQVRNEAAQLLAFVMKKFSSSFISLTENVVNHLVNVFLDFKKPLMTRYGSIIGLLKIDFNYVYIFLFPELKNIMKNLNIYFNSKNEIERIQSRHIKDALSSAWKQKLKFEKESNNLNIELYNLAHLYLDDSIESDQT